MTMLQASRKNSGPNKNFRIGLAKSEDGHWVLSIDDDAGISIVPDTDLTLDEAIRMLRLTIVTMAYPLPCQEKYLRNN